MSAFTQGFNFGILNGISNLYAGFMCNFGGFGGFGGLGFGYPGMSLYNTSLNFTPSLFMPANTGGFQMQFSPAAFSSFQSPPLVSSVFTTNTTSYIDTDVFNKTYSNPSFYSSKTQKTSSRRKTESHVKTNVKMNFDEMLKFVYKAEGGYNPDDCGQASNMGVQQSTYNEYRRSENLPTQDVKNITKEEARDLYYKLYYLRSGADKIKDPRLSLYVFDTAVNMGVSTAKRLLGNCGGSADKFNELRKTEYEAIAERKPEKKQYLNGWKNRVANIEEFADNYAVA